VEEKQIRENEQEGYVERPAWQVWAARAGLVLFLLFVVYQLLTLFRGGQTFDLDIVLMDRVIDAE